MQPSIFGEVVKGLYISHFQRVYGDSVYKMLYVIVHPECRKVKSLLDDIFIWRDDKERCWHICNGFGKVFTSIDAFQQQLHQQKRFMVVTNKRHFILHFTEFIPPAHTLEVKVPETLQFSFMTFNEKNFKWGASFTRNPPVKGIDSESSTQQYTLVKSHSGHSQSAMPSDCFVAILVDSKIRPFNVTIRDGESYFTDTVGHWVVCSHSGIIYARSLDTASNPLDVQWWQVFEDSKLQYSGMDVCVSVPGPVWTHDIKFMGSINDNLNCLFRFKGYSPPADDGMVFNVYEMADATRALVMQLNFSPKLQKWIIMSLDQSALPLQWNTVASSNCSGTYTNPTFCKEWYVLDPSGTYKYSQDMACEISARRLACAAVDVSQ